MPTLDHINIGIDEQRCKDGEHFLVALLGFRRVQPGPEVSTRFNPIWFEGDDGKQVHLSLVANYAAVRSSHLALLFAEGLMEVVGRLAADGYEIEGPLGLDGSQAYFVSDPSGNRWELRDTRGAV